MEKLNKEYKKFLTKIQEKQYCTKEEETVIRDFMEKFEKIERKNNAMKTIFMNSLTGNTNEILANLPVTHDADNWMSIDNKYNNVWFESSRMFWNSDEEKFITFALSYDVKFPCMDSVDDNQTCVVVRKFDRYGHYLDGENALIIGIKGVGIGCDTIPENENQATELLNKAVFGKNVHCFNTVESHTVSSYEKYMVCNSEIVCNDMDEDIGFGL